jgi:hypothetical protein
LCSPFNSDAWKGEFGLISGLAPFADDPAFQKEWRAVKKANKQVRTPSGGAKGVATGLQASQPPPPTYSDAKAANRTVGGSGGKSLTRLFATPADSPQARLQPVPREGYTYDAEEWAACPVQGPRSLSRRAEP